MTDARPVTLKSSRDLLKSAEAPPVTALEMHDRRNITVRWFSRSEGRENVFTGQIRILSVPELHRAVLGFARLTGGVLFDALPIDIRTRLWIHARLFVMLEGQPGSSTLLDACDTDRTLLYSVWQEVDKLEAECFRDVLGEGEGSAGTPRVVVATSRASAATGPSDRP